MPKKILVLTTVYPRWEGDYFGLWIQELAKSLDSLEWIVVCPHAKGSKKEETDGNIRIHRFRYCPTRAEMLGYGKFLAHEWAHSRLQVMFYTFKRIILFIPYIISMFFSTLRLATKEKPDLLFVHLTIPCGPVGVLVSKLTGIRTILKVYGTDLVMLKRLHLSWFGRWILRKYPFIISNSTYSKELALSFGGIPESHITSIPEGVHRPKISPSNRKKQRSAWGVGNQLVIGTVHRLVPLKGTEFFLHAAKRVVRKIPHSIVVIGGEGPEEAKLKLLAAELGIEKNVRFLGRVKDVAECIDGFDINVITSTHDEWGNAEGLGVPVIVALSVGCPTVGFAVGGPKDTIIDGITGFLVSDRDTQTMADRIVQIAKDTALAKKLSIGAKKQYAEQFTWNKVAAQYRRIFFGVLDHKL